MRFAFFTAVTILLGAVAAASLWMTISTITASVQAIESIDATKDASLSLAGYFVMGGTQFAIAAVTGSLAGKAWRHRK